MIAKSYYTNAIKVYCNWISAKLHWCCFGCFLIPHFGLIEGFWFVWSLHDSELSKWKHVNCHSLIGWWPLLPIQKAIDFYNHFLLFSSNSTVNVQIIYSGDSNVFILIGCAFWIIRVIPPHLPPCYLSFCSL